MTSDMEAPKLQGLRRNSETGPSASPEQTASKFVLLHVCLARLPAVREGINFHTWRNKHTNMDGG